MKIVDVNLLIYAVNRDAPLHNQAKRWLEGLLSGNDAVGMPWLVLLAFLRLTTRAGLFRQPLEAEAAFQLVEAWLAQPNVVVVEPGPHHVRTLRRLLLALGTAGNLTTDAHLAAIAMEHGAELCSVDADFARFPALKWRNPLA